MLISRVLHPARCRQLEKLRAANEACSERLLTFVSSVEDLTSRMLDAILKLMITTSGQVDASEGDVKRSKAGEIQQQKRALQMAVQWGHDEKATELIDECWQLLDPSVGAMALEVALQTAFESQVR